MILDGWIVQGNNITGKVKPDAIGDSLFFMAIQMEIEIILGNPNKALDIYKLIVIDHNCIRHPRKPEYQRDGVKKINHVMEINKPFKKMVIEKFGHDAVKLPLGEGLGIGKAQGVGILKWFQEYPFKHISIFNNMVWLAWSLGIVLQVRLHDYLGHLKWFEGFYSLHLTFLDFDVVAEKSGWKIFQKAKRLINWSLEKCGHENWYIQHRCRKKMSVPYYQWGHTEFSPQRDMRSKVVNGIETNHDRVGNKHLVSHMLDKKLYEAIKWNLNNT